MKTYDIVEVAKDCYQFGQWKKHWFGKPTFKPTFATTYPSAYAAQKGIEEHEKYLRWCEEQNRVYPRHVRYGYVACDGVFHQLREDGR